MKENGRIFFTIEELDNLEDITYETNERIKKIEEMSAKEFFEFINLKLLGGSLSELHTPKHDLIGRDEELHDLKVILEYAENPVAIILAEAGAGKTTLVEMYKKENEIEGIPTHLISLEVGTLIGGGGKTAQTRLESLLPLLKVYQDKLQEENPLATVVLFIDEVHTIISSFGEGTKLGGDLLKRTLARNYIRVITATTRAEFDTYISGDAPLMERLHPLEMNQVSPEIVKSILRNWAVKNGGDSFKDEEVLSDETLNFIIKSNKIYREGHAEPRASLDIMQGLLAYNKVDNLPTNIETVKKVFKKNYSIDFEVKEDFKHIMETLKSEVIGQPFALHQMDKAVKRMVLKTENDNRPKITMLFVGSTGVGKTQTVKALSKALYGTTDNIKTISMTDYTQEKSEDRFRRVLGTTVSHLPSSIILIDEMEKAHTNVLQSLLPILDEGRVTYTIEGRDGSFIERSVSLRNTIFIATSNAGHDVFDDKIKNSRVLNSESVNDENYEKIKHLLEEEWSTTEPPLLENLKALDNISPELLGRFQAIVPYYPLSIATKMKITKNLLDKKIEGYNDKFNISILRKRPVDWNKELYQQLGKNLKGYLEGKYDSICMYILYTKSTPDDSTDGGARNIVRIINNYVVPVINDAIIDNPNVKEFILYADDDNRFINHMKDSKSGGLICQPLEEYKYGKKE